MVYFYVSPYRRALQTLLCLGKCVDGPTANFPVSANSLFLPLFNLYPERSISSAPHQTALRSCHRSIERARVAGVREEPRLREQDFGNFQSERLMRESKRDRVRFGRFFFRFPEGA